MWKTEEGKSEMRLLDLAIIGAGHHALYLLLRLPQHILENTIVIDSTGRCLHAWWQRCKALKVKFLRNRIDNMLLDNMMSFEAYARHCGEPDDVCLASSTAVACPSARLYRDYCKDILGSFGVGKTAGLMRRDLTVAVKQDSDGDMLHLRLASGQDVAARHVVYAANESLPRIPSFMQRLEDGPHVAPAGKILLAEDVNMEGYRVCGEKIAIIGGGMTGVNLACEAIACGAQAVVIISHCQLRCDESEVISDWYPGHLKLLWKEKDPHKRLWMIREARSGASVHQILWKQLTALQEESKVHLFENHKVTSASWTSQKWKINLVSGDTVETSGVDSVLHAVESVCADRIWVATGRRWDVKKTCLAYLASDDVCPTRIVGGYPVLHDRNLKWPGANVHVMGGLASLSLGTMAQTFVGAQLAADLIVMALSGPMDTFGPLRSLSCRTEVKAEDLINDCLDESDMRGIGQPSSNFNDFRMVDDGSQPLPRQRPDEMLDGDGAAVSKVITDKGIVHLTTSLMQVEVKEPYLWYDDGLKIRIILVLGEFVDPANVHSNFREEEVEVWAICKGAIHHFHIFRLLNKVLVGKCKILGKEGYYRVDILLEKADKDATWVSLTA